VLIFSRLAKSKAECLVYCEMCEFIWNFIQFNSKNHDICVQVLFGSLWGRVRVLAHFFTFGFGS